MESTYGIGETARRTGLSVSSLRFYDRQGVLVPASVDPRSGYRRYTPDQIAVGRLVARLRRVGLPLAEVARVLQHRRDPAAAQAVLDAHLRRLEHGLELARRELSTVLHDLDPGDHAMSTTLTLPATALDAALRGVRFAVGDDTTRPALAGVLLDLHGDALRVVATDRYRLAVATATVVRPTGGSTAGDEDPDAQALVPAPFADEIRAACTAAGDTLATVTLGPRTTVSLDQRVLTTPALDAPFPPWELLVDLHTTDQVTLDATTLRESALAAAATTQQHHGVDYPACAFRVTGDGLVWLTPDDPGDGIAVNREFLIEALDALDCRQLVLGLTSPCTPLAFSSTERPGTFSILMPVHRGA